MDYPLFRKNSIGNSTYKIISSSHFIEKQKIGKHVQEYEIKASQYPEMLLIQDLTNCASGLYLEINEEEYLHFGCK